MRRPALILMMLILVLPAAYAQSVVEPGYDPPLTTKSALDAAVHPIPQETVAGYLTHLQSGAVFDVFEGQNALLKSVLSNSEKGEKVATGYEIDLDASALFTNPFTDGAGWVYLGSVTSLDALALRILVDLENLASGQELWLIDPTGPRAFGPFSASDHIDGGRWLPTVDGDTAVVMVKSASQALPDFSVIALSHFYKGFNETDLTKALSCNINIACETSTSILSVATAVGLMVVSDGTYDNALCSGTLINNADTTEFEPYFITANHCVPSAAEADQVDIVWDYEATACGANDPPSISSLPRSNGQSMLATSSVLDMTLIQLDTVPSGTNGRTYAGYSLNDVSVGQQVFGIHHPGGTHKRISYGAVRDTGVQSYLWESQIEVLWSQGVTENGSSGSGLFTAGSGPYLIGCLSNGPSHSCVDTSNNYDNFGSLQEFFPQISAYLTGNSSSTTSSSDCPAKVAFENDQKTLAQLRVFRDQGLGQFAWGRTVIAGYYQAAPFMAKVVDRSPLACSLFGLTARPFAVVGGFFSE